MNMDLFHNVKVLNALDIQAIASDTTTVGEIIDTQDWESLVLGIHTGTVTDGDYAILVEHGDDAALSDAAAVTDDYLLGTEAGASFTADTDDNKISKVGYIGCKRYVRMSIVSTSTTTGATLGGYAILSHGRYVPDSTQVR